MLAPEKMRRNTHQYIVMNGDSLADHHQRVQRSQTLPVSLNIRSHNRRRSSVLETIGITTHHVVNRGTLLSRIIRFKFIAIVLGSIIMCCVRWQSTIQFAKFVLNWISGHPLKGSLIVISCPAITSILCIPVSSVICIGCGFAYYREFGYYGIAASASLFWIGSSIGATIAFFLSRYLFGVCILSMAERNTKFRILNEIVGDHGIKVALLIRSMPMPLEVQNYVLGVTLISFPAFLLSLIGLVPSIIFCSILGSTVSHFSDISSVRHALLSSPFVLIAGAISLVLLIVMSIIAAKKFNEIEEEYEKKEQFINQFDTVPAWKQCMEDSDYPSISEMETN